jgi:putative Mg2+ transporter-C (MgtC) family protein
LLALGAALFGVVSVGAFDSFVTDDATNVRVDVTRIASYVAAGVGFIGGGAILKHAGTVRGITTATSLWTASAVGLAAGLGAWVGAVTATAIALIALAALKPLSGWIDRHSHPPRSLVVHVSGPSIGAAILQRVQDTAAASIRSMRLGQGQTDGTFELVVEFWTRPDDEIVSELIGRLDDEFGGEIRSVSLQS